MQIKGDVESAYWIIAPLAVIAIGVAVILDVALPLPGAKLVGGFFLALGAMNVFLRKRTGRQIFARTQSSWRFIAGFWTRIGEKGAQFLFLGIGIILALAGCVLLAAGVA
jgi:hypothetical protein